jgi:hypothetical protein
VNLIATVVFGGLMMFSVAQFAVWGKIRNPKVVGRAGIISGIVGVYASWVWYIWAVTNFKLLVLGPYSIWLVMQSFAATGVWTLHKVTPTGFALYGIWLAEAVCVIFITSKPTPLKVRFCETCDQWMNERGRKVRLEWIDVSQLRAALVRDDFELLTNASKAAEDATSFLEIEISQCSTCLSESFVSIESNRTTTAEDGSASTSAEIICIALRVPSPVASSLLKRSEEAAMAKVPPWN